MPPNTYEELVSAIRDGTYPTCEELLADNIDASSVPALQQEIAKARQELTQSISQTSKGQAEDIDGWIEQAKKVQADIVRCKEEARLIVEEHQRVEALRATRDDSRNKVALLRDEIGFNEALESQIQAVAEISQSLHQIDLSITEHRLLQAAQALPGLSNATKEVSASQPRALLEQSCHLVRERLGLTLRDELDQRFVASTSPTTTTIEIRAQPPAGAEHGVTTDQILRSFEALELTQDSTDIVLRMLDRSLLPRFYRRAKLKIASASVQENLLLIEHSSSLPLIHAVIEAVKTIDQYFQDHLPPSLHDTVLPRLFGQLIPLLITEWLDHAVPAEIAELPELHHLQQHVQDLLSQLNRKEVGSLHSLELWSRQLPRTWLARRRTASLDLVRQAFIEARGVNKQAERVETQVVTLDSSLAKSEKADDWDAGWGHDEDEDVQTPTDSAHTPPTEDEEGDAWGFDDDQESKHEPAAAKQPDSSTVEDNEAEAWGWGDDDDTDEHGPKTTISLPTKAKGTVAPNGNGQAQPAEQEITLAESYTITDIPDLVLAIIKTDLQDAQKLDASPPPPLFGSSSIITSMKNIPTLILSLYRAIAPTAYTVPPLALTTLHLYNDTLYLADQLPGLAANGYSSLANDTANLNNFARQTYNATLQTHHTLLNDLLDTAQGFVSCTRPPYAQACETAISSTVSHLRTLHAEWQTILSRSHLQQALGSLLSSVLNKVITDILDLEDISESESKRLVSYLDQLSSVSDLFPSQDSAQADATEPAPTMVHIFVRPWFRFQYLKEILDSNLMDIKYMWTESGLSEDFDKDEVIDLIRALFAESPRRREVIQGIKNRS